MNKITDNKIIETRSDTRTSPFGENVSGEQAYVRSERIVSAIYLVTNHVREDEPIRTRIRSLSHDLLHLVLDIRNGIRAAASHRLDATRATIRELISLTYLLHTGGYLSRQNTEILGNALDELGQFFTFARNSNLSDSLHLKREDFLPGDGLSARRERVSIPTSGQTASSDATDDELSKKGGGRVVNAAVHSERQQLIIDILKKSGKLGIKDITSQMVGCSEKTVQRELAVLVKNGIVQKDGEKRWSGYILTP